MAESKGPSDKPRPTRLLNQYERGSITEGPSGQAQTPEARADGWYKKPALGRPDREQPENMQPNAGVSLGAIHGNRMLTIPNVKIRR